MNVRNCRKCGKIFNYIAGPQTCPACREAMEAKFQEVKEYVRENGNATIPDISAACDVDQNQIKQWVREERLTFSDESVGGIECEICGVLIKTGRFCDKCKFDIAKGLTDATKVDKPQEETKKQLRDAARMRFLDKY